jgi:hypothetical protein
MGQFMPLCWKCAKVEMEPDYSSPGAFVVVGCKDNDKIKNFADAMELCPLQTQAKKTIRERNLENVLKQAIGFLEHCLARMECCHRHNNNYTHSVSVKEVPDWIAYLKTFVKEDEDVQRNIP